MLVMDYKPKFWYYVLGGSTEDIIHDNSNRLMSMSLAWIPHSALKVRGLTFGRYL